MALVAVIDTETTGLDPKKCGVVELAAVILNYQAEGKTLEILGDFQTLVDPGHEIPPEASAVHHLVTTDVAGKSPPLGEAVSTLLTKLETLTPPPPAFSPETSFSTGNGSVNAVNPVLIAHNAVFDHSFLPDLHKYRWGCTLKTARKYLEAPRNDNQFLRYFLKLTPEFPEHCGNYPHRALYDCYCTVALLRHLLTVPGVNLGTMVRSCFEPQLLTKVGFGKHNGARWGDLPSAYLAWIISSDFGPDEKFTANFYLNKRGEAK